MFSVYCLTSPSGKKYVGLTKHSAEARFKKHTKCAFSRVQDCPKLYRAIRKYGKQHFVVETLQSCETLAQAQLAEVAAIASLNTITDGYNITRGGDAGGGQKRQFCPQGHDTHVVGRSRSGGCKVCGRASTDRWAAQNRERIAARTKRRRQTPEWRAARQLRRNENNKLRRELGLPRL